MVFNNVTNSLRLWCEETAAAAYQASRRLTSGSSQAAPLPLSCRAASALGFWLGSLTDAEFEDFSAYRAAVRSLLPVRITPPLPQEMNRAEQYRIQKVESAFLDRLKSLCPDCASPGIPYFRILSEEEASGVKARFREEWGFRENSSWYPLSDEDLRDGEALFVMDFVLAPYLPGLLNLLGLPDRHVYRLTERWYDLPNCFETAELEPYDGNESVYAAKDFSWLIYFSHESTVTFAGAIVKPVKELLRQEEARWNRYLFGD